MLYDSQVLKYLRDCNSELERLKQKKLKEERGKKFDVYTLYNQITDHLFYITEWFKGLGGGVTLGHVGMSIYTGLYIFLRKINPCFGNNEFVKLYSVYLYAVMYNFYFKKVAL